MTPKVPKVLSAVLLAMAATVAIPASGSASPGLPVVTPVLPCAALPGVDLTGAAITVTSATEMSTGYELCDVKGTIESRIRFELQLPTRTWTQRYLQTGCGAFCGYLGFEFDAADGCAPLEHGELAIAMDDTGHVGVNAIDTGWARADRRARADFGFRSEHLLAVAAKRVIATFYGHLPRYSYFDGCSTGGRQALMEAQRFPHDFDGIIAGAPGNIAAPLYGESIAYLSLANRDAAGRQILGPEKLAPLHRAVLDACDTLDGLRDGQIDDPRRCRFDPASVSCPSEVDLPGCLTPAQVVTVGKFYAGARDPHGTRLYPGGLEPGSELNWSGWTVATPDQPLPFVYQAAESYLRDMAYVHNPPPSFTLPDARFDAGSFAALRPMDRVYGAEDPDLSAFRDAGGKLIVWHGWGDQVVPPRGTLAYRQAMEDRMGGYTAVQRFARLFMLPQVAHCGGGNAPDAIDLLSALFSWVEHADAPAQIVASQRTDGSIVRTRPIYDYPVVAAYNGTGDINSATNFHPFAPAHRPDDHVAWMGAFR